MTRPIDADDLMYWSEIVPLTDDGGIDINDFEEKLKSMPTIKAGAGEWLFYCPDTCICSECAFIIPDYFENMFRYCPNCGADMRGEENDRQR